MSEEESDVQETEADPNVPLDTIVGDQFIHTQRDFFFGDVEMDAQDMEYDSLNGLQNGQVRFVQYR